MQGISRGNRRQLTRFAAALIVAILGALFGRGHWGGNSPRDASGPLPDQISGAARLIDGDSLFVGRDEVRMKGIDAPEAGRHVRGMGSLGIAATPPAMNCAA